MSDRKRLRRPRSAAKFGFGAVLATCGVTLLVSLFSVAAATPGATGATTTPTWAPVPTAPGSTTAAVSPQSLASCGGTLRRDPQGDDWYDYSFSCSQAVPAAAANANIVSYSIIATRPNIDGLTFDQNNIAGNNPPAIYLPGGSPDAETLYCNSDAPSDGFDCNSEYVVTTGGSSSTVDPCYGGTTAAAYSNYGCIPAGDTVQGSLQLSQPYCSYLPKKAKPGTPAVPRATVDLIVTDDSGAEDGPFELTAAFRCAKVPAVVPEPKTKKKPTKKKAKSKSGAASAKGSKKAG